MSQSIQESDARPADESVPALAAPGSLRELWLVAMPLMISSGSLSLMHVVDRIFLTWVSVDALAASMPAGVFNWTVMSIPFGVAMYTNTFVAQYDGAGRHDRVVASLWQGGVLALLSGLLLLVGVPLAGPIFHAMGHAENVREMEIVYFRTLICGAVPMLLAAVLSSFFSGRGQTRVVMWVHLGSALLNAVLDYVLIFGAGPFPELGIFGAALATVLANVVACAVFGILVWRIARSEGYPLLEQRRVDLPLLGRLVRFGVPNGMQVLVDIGAFCVFVVVVGQLGTNELAATNIALNLNSLAFVPMFGLGTAVMTLVGRRIGQDEPLVAEKSTWSALRVSLFYMAFWAGTYLFLPDLLLMPYAAFARIDSFAEIRPVVVVLLRFVAIYSVFDALAIVFGSAIRGAGDTRFSFWWTLACGWCLLVLPAWWLSRNIPEHGLYGCWGAASVYITAMGVGFCLRFRGGLWKSMRVIESGEEAVPDDLPLP
ncbi:Multidrug resistance protein MdtK [Maioricimonas rarisocia]|uniref:Multidrug-efflux transporter n=1 Tax=Maioricimonas rarisocia TaxID=2528026 RepID=A0A517ZFZ2_9PLAN|nr:MATE family efflux transporter [Maioricimonas rarisocia]QDU41362.1 Multidrug resistance protein MdtK [Maioricimonas rarisocia]